MKLTTSLPSLPCQRKPLCGNRVAPLQYILVVKKYGTPKPLRIEGMHPL